MGVTSTDETNILTLVALELGSFGLATLSRAGVLRGAGPFSWLCFGTGIASGFCSASTCADQPRSDDDHDDDGACSRCHTRGRSSEPRISNK